MCLCYFVDLKIIDMLAFSTLPVCLVLFFPIIDFQ